MLAGTQTGVKELSNLAEENTSHNNFVTLIYKTFFVSHAKQH